MKKNIYTATAATIAGTAHPAGYSVAPDRAVYVFIEQLDGRQVIKIAADHPDHPAALAAAREAEQATRAEIAAMHKRPTKQAAPAPRRFYEHYTGLHDEDMSYPTPEQDRAAAEVLRAVHLTWAGHMLDALAAFLAPVDDSAAEVIARYDRGELAAWPVYHELKRIASEIKQEPATEQPARRAGHAPITEQAPEWLNTRIRGRGWVIDFDGAADRTMVLLTADVTEGARQLLAAGGFHYAPSTGTYNKKLSWKAYRAALKLADGLRRLYA